MVYDMSPRSRRRGSTPFGCGVLLALALFAVAGCGVRADHTAGAGEGDPEASLPTLPPVEERLPESYDADGCLLLAEGRDCGATAEDLDQALAGDESFRTLAGFQGPLFTTDVSAGALTVLDGTLSVATTGPWRAQGLVRNETTSPVLAPEVTAVLRDGAGAEVGRVTAPALVAPVRSGEPAPFVLESDVDAAAVASVDWSVVDAGGAPPLGTRSLGLDTYFVEPAGDREPLHLYLYDESGPGPRPHVLYGSVTDLADVGAPRPTVVAAWLGDDGRVRAVTESAAVEPDGSPTAELAPGQFADFLLTVDTGASGLVDAPMLLWGVSR